MIGMKIRMSRESEKQVLINELNLLGIYENMKSEPLDSLDYYTLRSMLATEMAVRV